MRVDVQFVSNSAVSDFQFSARTKSMDKKHGVVVKKGQNYEPLAWPKPRYFLWPLFSMAVFTYTTRPFGSLIRGRVVRRYVDVSKGVTSWGHLCLNMSSICTYKRVRYKRLRYKRKRGILVNHKVGAHSRTRAISPIDSRTSASPGPSSLSLFFSLDFLALSN